MSHIMDIDVGLLVPGVRNPNKMSDADFVALKAGVLAAHKESKRAAIERGESLDDLTILQPPLVSPNDDGTFEIVDGEHRWRAWKACGLSSTIRCVVQPMSPEARRAFRMGFNKNRGDIDLTVARDELADLSKTVDVEALLAMSGVSVDEYNALMASLNAASTDDTPLGGAPVEEAPPDKPFVLEVPFRTKEEKAKCQRALKRAAGAGGTLGTGLLNVLGELEMEAENDDI